MEALDNLVKIKKLNKEPPNQEEFDGMLQAAKDNLQDANVAVLTKRSQFTLAYGAAHSLALAALRWHGYRTDSRYIVFQCLKHTANMPDKDWRVFSACHDKRNLAEYEGHLDVEEALLNDLLRLTAGLLEVVKAMAPVPE